ncbi:hypothetical protein P168DRAFT_190472 [Aspergillus campestris IBT 28561]|uniref:Uncharacterized protein n=1 Tax=Aspergillus campestris (strain IBT 28561) TaxID=1392248 RepID=A0A2I1CYM9_ASPC2|nr:uncharacterized protein P168DRAFT_190472 [Aspergillus campestris IBT 28561]PKY02721.1 hypothetical protein P168DRAFT_190472 [Aspergillus campestris IBT 28561]
MRRRTSRSSGVYLSVDGPARWSARERGWRLKTDFSTDKRREMGKIVRRLYIHSIKSSWVNHAFPSVVWNEYECENRRVASTDRTGYLSLADPRDIRIMIITRYSALSNGSESSRNRPVRDSPLLSSVRRLVELTVENLQVRHQPHLSSPIASPPSSTKLARETGGSQ